jgi:hypothetical protein
VLLHAQQKQKRAKDRRRGEERIGVGEQGRWVRGVTWPNQSRLGQTWPSLALTWAEQEPTWAQLGQNLHRTRACWLQLGPNFPPTGIWRRTPIKAKNRWAGAVLFWTQLEPKSPIGHVGLKFQSDPDGPQIEAM